MKLRIVSDLHFERHMDDGASLATEIAAGEFDVLVCAGDLASFAKLRRSVKILAESAAPKPVLYVLGNHEPYGATLRETYEEAAVAVADTKNVVLFDGEMRRGMPPRDSLVEVGNVTTIAGQRFVGTTLWFPHPERTPYDDWLSDFDAIEDFSEWIDERARRSRLFLERTVEPGDVVITHHLPHPRSIAARFRDHGMNRFFLHDVSGIVERAGAKLWIHGHTHSSCDYVAGGTRVVCNPHGYARADMDGEPNPEFDPTFTVDIEAGKRRIER